MIDKVDRPNVDGSRYAGKRVDDLLIFVVHVVVEFGMTDLTEHFSVDLSSVTIGCIFVVFFFVFFPFRLGLLGQLEGEKEGRERVGRTGD